MVAPSTIRATLARRACGRRVPRFTHGCRYGTPQPELAENLTPSGNLWLRNPLSLVGATSQTPVGPNALAMVVQFSLVFRPDG